MQHEVMPAVDITIECVHKSLASTL